MVIRQCSRRNCGSFINSRLKRFIYEKFIRKIASSSRFDEFLPS